MAWVGDAHAEATQRVRVAVRVRPPLETDLGKDQCVFCDPDGRQLTIDPPQGARGMRSYSFDSVCGPETSQEQFFSASGAREMLDAVLDGYTATIFAYGQTGSGKTYTVSGASGSRGVSGNRGGSGRGSSEGLMQRAASYLYAGMRARPEVKYTVRATFLEIYNEQVVDLIEPSTGPLGVRGSSTGGFYVEDLSVTQCRDETDMHYVIQKGLDNRHRRNHALNSESSRSHSIFSIYLDVNDAANGRPMRYGRISLLDLAGSENVRSSQSHGIGLKEAGSINRSLFALGQVVKALAVEGRSGGKGAVHVPFRDSNLTKLLSDSLGGSSLTLMIACCSTLTIFGEESMRTLQYACSAGAIRNRPAVKLDPQEQLIAELKDEVHKLKQQVDVWGVQGSGSQVEAVMSKAFPVAEVASDSRNAAATQVKFLRHELTISNSRLAEHGLETMSSSSPRPMSANGVQPQATVLAPPAGAESAGGWAPRQVTVNLAALCDRDLHTAEVASAAPRPAPSSQEPASTRANGGDYAAADGARERRITRHAAPKPYRDYSLPSTQRTSAELPAPTNVSVDLRAALASAKGRAAAASQQRGAAYAASAELVAAAELTGTIGSEQLATGAGDEGMADEADGGGLSSSPAVGGRRTRERELEKQLRSLSTFSATDVIIAQAEGHKWYNQLPIHAEPDVPQCTVSLADLDSNWPPAAGLIGSSSKRAGSHDEGISARAERKDETALSLSLDARTQAALGNVNGADALQEYREKARALRAKEYELERSLRSLAKYSATAIISNGRS